MHTNDGGKLSGGIVYNTICKSLLRDLSVMPGKCYDAPGGTVERRFTWMLGTSMRRVYDWKCNTERFIIFQMVIMQ